VTLVRLGFGCLWAHSFSSLALVTAANIQKPFDGPAFESRISPRPPEASGSSCLGDYFFGGETSIDSAGRASDRGGSSTSGDHGGVHQSCSPC
jgi:hypothetical protein